MLHVDDNDARSWYEKEAIDQSWSVRTLQRNVSTQYYYRLLISYRTDLVEKEMLENIDINLEDKQLYATKYKTYLLGKEELKREIERQKKLSFIFKKWITVKTKLNITLEI